MEPRQTIPAGVTASAIAHLTVLILVLLFADVHPFGAVTAETIAVDIVSPKEVAELSKEPEAKPPEKPPPEKPLFEIPSFAKPESSRSPAPAPAGAAPAPAAASAQAAAPQKQAAPPAPVPDKQQAAAQPQPPSPSPVPPPMAVPPDLTVKYHVALGLPQTSPSDGFDAPASAKADVASNLAAEFRQHLRTCSKLPEQIAPTDKVKIKLRVFMTPDGKLSADPVLIEASASTKGPALMQSVISALRACQPYAMLPSDRYGEWKMLDLSFTPQDFAGG
jgi:hypothetical protein